MHLKVVLTLSRYLNPMNQALHTLPLPVPIVERLEIDPETKIETSSKKDYSDTINENEFAAALLILSPAETLPVDLLSKKALNVTVKPEVIMESAEPIIQKKEHHGSKLDIPLNHFHSPSLAKIKAPTINIQGKTQRAKTPPLQNPMSINFTDKTSAKLKPLTPNSVPLVSAIPPSVHIEKLPIITRGVSGLSMVSTLPPNESVANIAPSNITDPAIIRPPIRANTKANVRLQKDRLLPATARARHSPHYFEPISAQMGFIDTVKIGLKASATHSVSAVIQGQNIVEQLTDGIAHQITKARAQSKTISNYPPAPIIVQLSPAELGRIQIQFTFDASEKITAHIIAESLKTGEVLKQNSDILISHLKHVGFDNIQLSFETKIEKGFLNLVSNDPKNDTAFLANTGGRSHHNHRNKPELNTVEYYSDQDTQAVSNNFPERADLAAHSRTKQLDIII